MSRQIRIGAVLVIAALLCAALASLLLAEGGVGPFRIITHEPPVHALGVPLNANVRAMFYDDVNAATVTSATFVLHGNLGGLASGTLSYNAGTRVLTLDPNRAFHTGEVLRVSATSGISSTGGAALPPYGWQFTAGPAVDRRFVGFTDIGAGLTGVNEGSVAWGDYDNDGDLDILLTGNDSRFKRVSKVYRNDGGGAFADIGAGLTAVYRGSVAWGDYDNDRDLDILLTGHDSDFDEVSVVYRNDEGAFADIGAALAAVGFSSVAWGDYDNDGDLDILLTGFFPLMSKVYRNDGVAGFTDIGAGLTAVLYSSVAWGDYDNDGDLDVVLTGMSDTGPVSRVYRNAGGGTFNAIGAGLTGVYYGSVAWGDYDNDGDLDILLTGYDNPAATEVSKVYRNDGGAFTDIGAGLTGVHASSVAWGDYDNDGDLDILLTGAFVGEPPWRMSKVYRHDGGGVFTDIGAGLTGVHASSVAWGDYDNDGDLDILLTGWTGSARVSKVYRNESAPELGTVTPSSGSGPAGVTRYFNTTWRDPDGWQDLKRCYFHIGASPSPAGNVTLMYDVQDNKLWMRSDDGTTWLGGYAPWSNNTIEHRQAKVYCALTRDEGSGDTLSVRWAIKFKADFRGVKKTGLKCTDLYGVRAKGAWMGTWNIY